MATERLTEFNGVFRAARKTNLPGDKAWVDEGGDHYELGVWKLRRGQRHTSIEKQGNQVKTILGFEIRGGDYSTLVIDCDGDATGHLNVTEQSNDVEEGFGVGEFGDGGFGE